MLHVDKIVLSQMASETQHLLSSANIDRHQSMKMFGCDGAWRGRGKRLIAGTNESAPMRGIQDEKTRRLSCFRQSSVWPGNQEPLGAAMLNG